MMPRWLHRLLNPPPLPPEPEPPPMTPEEAAQALADAKTEARVARMAEQRGW